jgi:hypothetical protein
VQKWVALYKKLQNIRYMLNFPQKDIVDGGCIKLIKSFAKFVAKKHNTNYYSKKRILFVERLIKGTECGWYTWKSNRQIKWGVNCAPDYKISRSSSFTLSQIKGIELIICDQWDRVGCNHKRYSAIKYNRKTNIIILESNKLHKWDNPIIKLAEIVMPSTALLVNNRCQNGSRK